MFLALNCFRFLLRFFFFFGGDSFGAFFPFLAEDFLPDFLLFLVDVFLDFWCVLPLHFTDFIGFVCTDFLTVFLAIFVVDFEDLTTGFFVDLADGLVVVVLGTKSEGTRPRDGLYWSSSL